MPLPPPQICLILSNIPVFLLPQFPESGLAGEHVHVDRSMEDQNTKTLILHLGKCWWENRSEALDRENNVRTLWVKPT
jgi:hypothetical protein